MVIRSVKTPKLIVYIQEFDRYDSHGRLLCRNSSCNSYPSHPYRKYCSKSCSQYFEHWYYHNFYWDRIRSDIFKRDNYTCQICKRRFPYVYRRKLARSNKLECDHIIPRSLYKQHGYEKCKQYCNYGLQALSKALDGAGIAQHPLTEVESLDLPNSFSYYQEMRIEVDHDGSID